MNEFSLLADNLWQLVAAFLVLSMQAGFLLLEAGRVRERNAVSVAQKNASDLSMCWAIFILCGYEFAFGIPSPMHSSNLDLAEVANFLFQLGFCGAAATIISGAVAERFRFSAYLLLTLIVAGVFYPLAVWSIWGNVMLPDRSAPLADIGFVDFAGGTAVHVLSGGIALAAALIVGPRLGRFSEDGQVNTLHGYSPVLQLLGSLVLMLGWLGFNAGSLSPGNPLFASALINTITAASFGALTGLLLGYFLDQGVFNPNRTINGLLAALVAITAGAPYAQIVEVMVLSVLAAGLALWCSDWLAIKFKIDDPLDVFATHGVAGILGTLAVAWFLPNEMLIAGSRFSQFIIQAFGTFSVLSLSFIGSYLTLRVINQWLPLRVEKANERLGLNHTEHGVRLDGERLLESISTSIADHGGFSDEVIATNELLLEESDIAVALRKMLDKHEQAQATITRQSERFRQFAATTNDLLWETDDRCILTMLQSNNDIATDDDLNIWLGSSLLDCFQTEEADRIDALHRIVDHRPLARINARLNLKYSKRLLNLRMNGVPYYDDDGRFKGYRGGATDFTNQKLAEERALYLANHDQLTSLMNRRALDNELVKLHSAGRVAIVIIDLDGFKAVNDESGHGIGDQLLCEVSNIICRMKRDRDQVFRIGGDEFVVLLHDLRDAYLREDATLWSERLINCLSQPMILNGHGIQIGASIGVSIFPEDGHDVEDLLRLADLALYEAKSQGKGQVVAFDKAMQDLAQQERKNREEIANAFQNEEFFLTFQPKLRLEDRRLVGFEALVRWQHPKNGVMGPHTFLRDIEQMGRMIEFGKWVLHKACTTAAAWPDQQVHIAVNVAPSQLTEIGFVDMVKSTLEKTGLDPERLELELTEEALLTGYEETQQIINLLRKEGISVAIDDFGCGSTSLQYLHRLPVNKLKIDKSFVSNLNQDQRALEIARSIVNLAKELSLSVTAEGIEEESQLSILTEWACDEIQGYMISKPITNDEVLSKWMTEPIKKIS